MLNVQYNKTCFDDVQNDAVINVEIGDTVLPADITLHNGDTDHSDTMTRLQIQSTAAGETADTISLDNTQV